MIITTFQDFHYFGAAIQEADKDKIVFVFDMDSTLTFDPDRTIEYESKEEYFDAARDFGPNEKMVNYARYFVNQGHRVAIATARPANRLSETIEWLMRHEVPFDQVMLSTDKAPSSLAKQAMIKNLQRYYKKVARLYDDSPYNIEGAKLQGVPGTHLSTNDSYWEANPEDVYALMS